MIMHKLLLTVTLAMSSCTVIAQEPLRNKTRIDKTLDYIAQSTPIYVFGTYIQSKLERITNNAMMVGNEPAAVEYQEMGKEAQDALGIPQDMQVPIKKIAPTSPIAQIVGALAQQDAIYVSEVKLNNRSYGARRCALFHEAVHKKYADSASHAVVELGAYGSCSLAAYTLIKLLAPKGVSKLVYGGAFVGSLVVASLIDKAYGHYYERRADIEGHYATQCFSCVQEHADCRRQLFDVENNSLKNNGYLGAGDLEKIAQALKMQGKVCKYHRDASDTISQ